MAWICDQCGHSNSSVDNICSDCGVGERPELAMVDNEKLEKDQSKEEHKKA